MKQNKNKKYQIQSIYNKMKDTNKWVNKLLGFSN